MDDARPKLRSVPPRADEGGGAEPAAPEAGVPDRPPPAGPASGAEPPPVDLAGARIVAPPPRKPLEWPPEGSTLAVETPAGHRLGRVERADRIGIRVVWFTPREEAAWREKAREQQAARVAWERAQAEQAARVQRSLGFARFAAEVTAIAEAEMAAATAELDAEIDRALTDPWWSLRRWRRRRPAGVVVAEVPVLLAILGGVLLGIVLVRAALGGDERPGAITARPAIELIASCTPTTTFAPPPAWTVIDVKPGTLSDVTACYAIEGGCERARQEAATTVVRIRRTVNVGDTVTLPDGCVAEVTAITGSATTATPPDLGHWHDGMDPSFYIPWPSPTMPQAEAGPSARTTP